MTTVEAQWTQESIVAIIVVPLVVIGLTVAAYFLRIKAMREDRSDGYTDYWFLQVPAVICALLVPITLVLLWWGMYPWKTEYHQWQPVSGKVASVDARLIDATGKFVVTFDGNPQQYGVMDTRAASIRQGDRLTITCVKRWQWSGTHGYDCNFVDLARG